MGEIKPMQFVSGNLRGDVRPHVWGDLSGWQLRVTEQDRVVIDTWHLELSAAYEMALRIITTHTVTEMSAEQTTEAEAALPYLVRSFVL